MLKGLGDLGKMGGIIKQAMEMKTRIENHRAERPANWRTLEAPLNVGEAVERELAEHPADVVER